MNEAKSRDPADAALGAVIRMRRRMEGLSQEDLARRCGVTFQQIQKYENGANRVSFSRLKQIAQALRCRVSDLTDPVDADDAEPGVNLELIVKLRTPGAVELLDLYEQLPPDVRSSVIQFFKNGLLPQVRRTTAA